jgi:cytochrome c oxidase accessory protein FixG
MNIDEGESFRDKVATIDESGKRKWVFAYKPSGKFYKARTWLSIFYLIVFFGLPFVQYKGEPFMMLNILERKFVIFGFVFWSQDFYLFGISMILFIVFIIVFSVAFGRLFCGWACPQTIFMEMVFRKLEYFIEGDAPKQIALKKAPWNAEKILKRASKYAVFYFVSFLIGNTFLAYIIGKDALLKIITEPFSQHVGGFTSMLIFSGVFFFVYIYLREQVCTVVCPYGRLQGVLLDKHSVVVAYDYVRGEPREKLRKNTERTVGDCIDCLKCVHVCPTGIDIRNGTQLECTHCTACIDACDSIMEKINKPTGLIKYASEATIAENKPFIVTARLKAYVVVLLILLIAFVSILATRSTIEMQVIKASGQLYVETPDGQISNMYNYMLINKSHNSYDSLELKLDGEGSVELVNGHKYISLKKEGSIKSTLFIKIPANKIIKRKQTIKVNLYHRGRLIEVEKTNFLGPVFN